MTQEDNISRIKARLAEIDEARAKATISPWRVGFKDGSGKYDHDNQDFYLSIGAEDCIRAKYSKNEYDCEFIALAANEITNLTSALNLASHVIENLMEERMAFPKIYADESLSEIANILSGGEDGK